MRGEDRAGPHPQLPPVLPTTCSVPAPCGTVGEGTVGDTKRPTESVTQWGVTAQSKMPKNTEGKRLKNSLVNFSKIIHYSHFQLIFPVPRA